MAHQPNFWSKHTGTQIEQVLAYCRDEQKYVGMYWAIILSHCDYDIWRTDLKIHRVDGRDTAYIPSKSHRNSFKNKREISVQHIFQGCLLVTLTFKPTSLKFKSSRLLVKDYQPAKLEDDGMINDREIAE